MRIAEAIYEAVVRLARPGLSAAAVLDAKLARGLAGRRDAPPRLEAWSREHRDRTRSLVWIHAPSAGEALMAQAIAAELRALRPDVQLAFTHFSPSAERFAPRVGADVWSYLPWDLRSDVRRALDALRPAAVVFVRTEIWPALVHEAARRGVPSLLVNAVLSEDSGRLRPAARALLRPAYASLAAVGAVAAEDAGRFVLLGVPVARIEVAGDARYDQVWARVREGAERTAALSLFHGHRVVVAGSTWPADERRLIPAWLRTRTDGDRLLIAPHEPSERHLAALERLLRRSRITSERLAESMGRGVLTTEAVVVDRVGVLADLYAAAAAAYVGGGFGRDGLHSVIEPAAHGAPVLFGPRAGNTRDAAELAAAGGGFRVEDETQLASALHRLVVDASARTEAGDRARTFVQSRLGGAERNARLVNGFLD